MLCFVKSDRSGHLRPGLAGAVIAAALLLTAPPTDAQGTAEVRKLSIEIRDSENVPVIGIRIKCRGYGEYSLRSSSGGLVEVPMPPGIQAGDQVEIELEPGTELASKWAFVRPLEGVLTVPNQKQRYVPVTIMEAVKLRAMLKISRY